MLTLSLNAVMTRLLIVAAVLGTIVFFAPAIFAQVADQNMIDYAENGTDPVRTFTSTDPEGGGIDWDVTGTDADDFMIDARGVLTFNSPPNFESPTDRVVPDGDDDDTDPDDAAGNNVYHITVRATEQVTEGDDVRALSTETDLTVTVTDVNEDGTVTMNRIQPEVGTQITAMLTDPDDGNQDPVVPLHVTGTVGTGADEVTLGWTWYVSKVTNPVANVESHWIAATGAGAATATYTPHGDCVDDKGTGNDGGCPATGQTDNDTDVDEGKYLRAVVMYLDMRRTDTTTGVTPAMVRKQIGVSLNPVRDEVSSDLDQIENPENGSPGFSSSGDYTREVPENTAKGMPVGDPVTAVDPNSDTLTYDLDVDLLDPGETVGGVANREPGDADPTQADTDRGFFSIDMATGQIMVAGTLDYDANMDGYKLYVRATDPSGETAHVEVTVKTADANDAPTIMGSLPVGSTETTVPPAASELRVDEQDSDGSYTGAPDMVLLGLAGSGLGEPNVFTAPDNDARGQIFWTLTGEDADDFALSQSSDTPNPTGPTGLSGPDEPIALRFKSPPDYENPTDSNMDSVYKVTLVATDSNGAADSRPVTVFVDQVLEQGKVTLDQDQPLIGQPVTAMVEDPDNGVAIVTWQWQRATSTDPAADSLEWEVIPGATMGSYTPVGVDNDKTNRNENDNGYYLRVVSTYTDITSHRDDMTDTTRDERTQKEGAGGTGTTIARIANTNGATMTDSDLVYRVRAVSKNAVRVGPDDPTTTDPPVFAMSSYNRTVVENAEAGSIVGDPVRVVPELDEDGDPKTTFSYNLDATVTGDDDYFSIGTTTGQIRVKAVDFPDPVPADVMENCEETSSDADLKTCPDMVDPTLDYEGTNTFALIVTAKDDNSPSRTTVTTVNIGLENLNEVPYFDKATREAVESNIEYGEQRTNAVVQLSGVEPDGHGLKWEVTGADASDFMIVDADDLDDGKDRVHLMFKNQPDFENGKGSSDSGVAAGTASDLYTVMVRATEMTAVGDGPKMAAEQPVTVRVTNAKEGGTVAFTLLQPEVGTAITASVTDLDGSEDVTTTGAGWQWYRAKVSNPNLSPDPDELGNEWTLITGATNAEYTPQGVDNDVSPPAGTKMDEGAFLLARVAYSDGYTGTATTTAAVGITAYPTRADVSNTLNNSPDFNASKTTRTIPEDTAVGMPVGDPVDVDRNEDGDVLTYEIVEIRETTDTGYEAVTATDPGNPNNTAVVRQDYPFFSIDQDDGQLRVKKKLSAEMTDGRNYDANDANAGTTGTAKAGEYTIVVRATDPSGEGNNENRDDIVVTVTASNVNEAPMVMGKAELAVNEADSSDDDSYLGLEHRLVDPAAGSYLLADGVTGQPTDTNAASSTTDNLYLRSEQDVVDRAIWPEPIAGPDGALFEYSTPDNNGIGRRLHFKSPPDFENPMDADGDNVYEVTITVTDTHGAMGEKAVRITVHNVSEEGKLTLSPEQPDDGMPVIATLTDPDGVVQITNWKWYATTTRPTARPGENDVIDDATTSEYTGDVGDFLWAMVEYRDGASVVDDVVTVLDERNASSTTDGTATDADDYDSDEMLEKGADNAVRVDPDPPTDPDRPATGVEMFTREVREDVPSTGYVGGPITKLGGRNAIGGPDGARFVFAENNDTATPGVGSEFYDTTLAPDVDDPQDKVGQLALNPVTHLDYETKDTYIIEITDPDSAVDISTYRITIMVLDVNEPPTAPSELRGPPPVLNTAPMFAATTTSRSVAEDLGDVAQPGRAVGDPVTATDTDRGDSLTYTLGGADAADFTIDAETGQISTSAALDYETKMGYMVTVTATDSEGETAMIYVTINVTNEGLDNRYDSNDDGTMSRDEVINAINDHLFGDGSTTRDDLISVINLHLFPPS